MSRKILLYFLACIFFYSCKKENAFDCFKSNGKEISETRYPGNFTKIEMNDKIDVTILQGAELKVEVIAGEHILRNISTKVKEGVLKIENLNKCNFVRGYKKHVRIVVTLPYCHSVLNNGVATLKISDDFVQDSIRIKAESSGDIHLGGTYTYIKAYSNGNGDLYLQGKCKSLDAFLNGTNFLRAEALSISDYAFIQTLSKGDCFFNAGKLNHFEYIVYNAGSIYYKGNPLSISGFFEDGATGKVVKAD